VFIKQQLDADGLFAKELFNIGVPTPRVSFWMAMNALLWMSLESGSQFRM
jgi:hypothetical protein